MDPPPVNGRYPMHITFKATAQPGQGASFQSWETGGAGRVLAQENGKTVGYFNTLPVNNGAYIHAVFSRGVVPPEIEISYNGVNIPNGISNPSAVLGTDFGGHATTGGSIQRTFRIRNSGEQILTLSQGTSTNGDFTISGLASSVVPGASLDFTVTFDPSSIGAKTATVSINNNDPDANPFTFTVRGDGTDPSAAPPGFSKITGGWFTIGDTRPFPRLGEHPARVYVREFFMGTHEVTRAQWDEVRTWAEQKGYSFTNENIHSSGQNHPVQAISWYDVVKWCNARSEREGRTPFYTIGSGNSVFRSGEFEPVANWDTNGYRLPTEAEWEKAARGGHEGRLYPWGNLINHSHANYNATPTFESDNNTLAGIHPTYLIPGFASASTAPVGSFAPNEFGLYDMVGNVSEWCWDWLDRNRGHQESSINPRGGVYDGRLVYQRIHRGGSWLLRTSDHFMFSRYGNDPEDKFWDKGFRLALNSPSASDDIGGPPSAFSDRLDSGSNIKWSGWLGWYNDQFWPWIWDYQHGTWLWVVDNGPENVWMWHDGLNRWMWTRIDWYPWVQFAGDSGLTWRQR